MSRKREISVQSPMKVQVPLVPNFLRTASGTCPVSDFDDESLRAIGKAWTEDLIARAKEQRASKESGGTR